VAERTARARRGGRAANSRARRNRPHPWPFRPERGGPRGGCTSSSSGERPARPAVLDEAADEFPFSFSAFSRAPGAAQAVVPVLREMGAGGASAPLAGSFRPVGYTAARGPVGGRVADGRARRERFETPRRAEFELADRLVGRGRGGKLRLGVLRLLSRRRLVVGDDDTFGRVGWIAARTPRGTRATRRSGLRGGREGVLQLLGYEMIVSDVAGRAGSQVIGGTGMYSGAAPRGCDALARPRSSWEEPAAPVGVVPPRWGEMRSPR